MSSSSFDAAARLGRLAIALDLRGGAPAPLLAAVGACGTSDVQIAASTHAPRFDVVMPYVPAALAALGGDASWGGQRIRARVDGPRSGAPRAARGGEADRMMTVVGSAVASTAGATDPRGAVDELAPASARDAWFDIVDQLCAISGGRVAGKVRWADGRRAIEVRYPARDPRGEDQAYLLAGIAQLAEQMGVSEAQRTLWQRVHVQYAGAEVVVTTELTAAGAVKPGFGIVYPETKWEQAVQLAQGTTLGGAAAATGVAKQMGALAGALGSDQLTAVEMELGLTEPVEVVVWAKLAPG